MSTSASRPSLYGKLGIPEGIDRPAMRMLLAVALAVLFEEYDTGILTAALKQVAFDLRIPDDKLALYLGLIRVGALPAFLFVPFADRAGRRPLFVFSIVAMGVLTALSAFAQTLEQFVILQALARTFALAGGAIAFVIVSEQLPAAHRGWGMGALAAIGATGHGVSAGLYSQIDVLPFGWRFLYAAGIVPVLLMPLLLRHIPETTRFLAMRASSERPHGLGFRDLFSPMIELARSRPFRTLGLATSGLASASAVLPTFQFASYFVQVQHGFSPAQYSLMVIVGGGVGIFGNVVAGRLGDSIGRKRVGLVMLGLYPAFSFGLYRAESSSVVIGSWIAAVFFSMGARLILRALSTELFPTSQRGAAAGVFAVFEAAGGVLGLMAAHAIGTQNIDRIANATPIVATSILLASVAVAFFPETKQRELEDIR